MTLTDMIRFLRNEFLKALMNEEDQEIDLSIICSNTLLINDKQQIVYFNIRQAVHLGTWVSEIDCVFNMLSQEYTNNLQEITNLSQKRKMRDNDDGSYEKRRCQTLNI